MNRPTSISSWGYLAALLSLGATLVFAPMFRCGSHIIRHARNPEEAVFMLRYSPEPRVVYLNGGLVGGTCGCCGPDLRISLFRKWTWTRPRQGRSHSRSRIRTWSPSEHDVLFQAFGRPGAAAVGGQPQG